MANPERGEVDLEVQGRRYRLALGMAGLRAIQRAVLTPTRRVTWLEVANGASAGDAEYLSVLLWGAMQRHHPEVTPEQVDDLIDALGGVQALPGVLQKVNELMAATTPDARDQAALKKTNAQPAVTPDAETIAIPPISTTGTRSTSRREKSA